MDANGQDKNAPTVLRKIIARKREEVVERQQMVPLDELKEKAMAQPPTRGFVDAITARASQGQSAVIAEIKKGITQQGRYSRGL